VPLLSYLTVLISNKASISQIPTAHDDNAIVHNHHLTMLIRERERERERDRKRDRDRAILSPC
jgi:hypothetical protein